jgi:hypothetical protein
VALLPLMRQLGFRSYGVHTWILVVDKSYSAVHQGVSCGGRFVPRGERDRERDGNRDTRHKIYTDSGHRDDVKPYVLCSII